VDKRALERRGEISRRKRFSHEAPLNYVRTEKRKGACTFHPGPIVGFVRRGRVTKQKARRYYSQVPKDASYWDLDGYTLAQGTGGNTTKGLKVTASNHGSRTKKKKSTLKKPRSPRGGVESNVSHSSTKVNVGGAVLKNANQSGRSGGGTKQVCVS